MLRFGYIVNIQYFYVPVNLNSAAKHLMRFIFLIVFFTLSLTASAQFWKRKHKPVTRDTALTLITSNNVVAFTNYSATPQVIQPLTLKRSLFELHIAQNEVLRQAKHNMRFGIFKLASYNFSDLAELYILENRFSEAKWYLLQSKELARQQNDDKHVIANLLDLAAIKLAIGEPSLAIADLQEAHGLAVAHGFGVDVQNIEKRIHDLKNDKSGSKATLRYAESVELASKSQ